jgi:hypothetical protein
VLVSVGLLAGCADRRHPHLTMVHPFAVPLRLRVSPPSLESVCARRRGVERLLGVMQGAMRRAGFKVLPPHKESGHELAVRQLVLVDRKHDDCTRPCVPATLVTTITGSGRSHSLTRRIRWCSGDGLTGEELRGIGREVAGRLLRTRHVVELVARGVVAVFDRPGAMAQRPPRPPRPGEARHVGNIVAVFDLQDEARSLDGREVAQISDYLAVRLTASAGYRVVPRGQLRTRLIDEKRRTYRDCFDQVCQIELGKALAADKSLATRLAPLGAGGGCLLTAVLFDLKTETTERAASIRAPCTAPALLEGVERLARSLGHARAGPVVTPRWVQQ